MQNLADTPTPTVATGDTKPDTLAPEIQYAPEVEIAELLPSITAQDFALLDKCSDAPHLRAAARALLELVEEPAVYPSANPILGRFEFSSYSDSSAQSRAAFRVIRAALDFLEADFLACEASNREFLRGEVEKLDAMMNGATK